MDYKKEIIEMLDKIKVDQILRYIYIIISDILKEENKNESCGTCGPGGLYRT